MNIKVSPRQPTCRLFNGKTDTVRPTRNYPGCNRLRHRSSGGLAGGCTASRIGFREGNRDSIDQTANAVSKSSHVIAARTMHALLLLLLPLLLLLLLLLLLPPLHRYLRIVSTIEEWIARGCENSFSFIDDDGAPGFVAFLPMTRLQRRAGDGLDRGVSRRARDSSDQVRLRPTSRMCQ